MRRFRSATLVLAVGAFGWTLCAGNVSAQTGLETCLDVPEQTCTDTLLAELLAIEAAIPDPDRRANAQRHLAVTLAEGARYDAAEDVLSRFQDPPGHPGLRDATILDVIAVLGAESAVRGQRLLSEMSDGSAYERARAHHVSNLVRHFGADAALGALDATDRAGRPLDFVGLDRLALALAQDGRVEQALRLINENIPDDAGRRGSLLSRILDDRIAAGQIDVAQSIFSGIDDPSWQAVAGARIAVALAGAGDIDGAGDAFARARAMMATMSDPNQRFYVFEGLARSALTMGRLDLAIAAIPDVSTYRFDQVDTLNMVAQIALSLEADVDVLSLLQEAMAVLEAGPSDGEDIAHRFDRALAFLAQSMAMAGDVHAALRMMSRVRDPQRRAEDLAAVALSLIGHRNFDDALTLLAAQTDFDLQAEGLIALARTADDAGVEAYADIATGMVLGLVEGPEWVPLTDYTISLLAELESRQGQFAVAEQRLRFLDDARLRRLGRIANLGNAARSGTEEEFSRYLDLAREAVSQVDDPAAHAHLTRNLVMQLVFAHRFDDALSVARDIGDATARDTLLTTMVSALNGYGSLSAALQAAEDISDPSMRQDQRRMVFLHALRRSLAL